MLEIKLSYLILSYLIIYKCLKIQIKLDVTFLMGNEERRGRSLISLKVFYKEDENIPFKCT